MATQRNLGRVKGDDAIQPTIDFTTPVTLPPGSSATVVNTGTSINPVLRLGIPAGLPGQNGQSIQGPRGLQGDPGPKGDKGDPATIKISNVYMVDTPGETRVVNNGTNRDADYDFYLYGGADLIVPPDEEFIEDSENSVQSKVIQSALAEKADTSSLPTKVSELENDRGYVSESGLDVRIEDKVMEVASIAVPIDDELSDLSNNPVQNRVITEELGKKLEMQIEDLLDDTDTKYGERVTFSCDDRDLSIDLQGTDIITATLTKTIAGRQPTIVAALPDEGDETLLYLVPTGGNNYSMHIWMDIAGTMGYASVSGGGQQPTAFRNKLFSHLSSNVMSRTNSNRIEVNGIRVSITNKRMVIVGYVELKVGQTFQSKAHETACRFYWDQDPVLYGGICNFFDQFQEFDTNNNALTFPIDGMASISNTYPYSQNNVVDSRYRNFDLRFSFGGSDNNYSGRINIYTIEEMLINDNDLRIYFNIVVL